MLTIFLGIHLVYLFIFIFSSKEARCRITLGHKLMKFEKTILRRVTYTMRKCSVLLSSLQCLLLSLTKTNSTDGWGEKCDLFQPATTPDSVRLQVDRPWSGLPRHSSKVRSEKTGGQQKQEFQGMLSFP